MPTRCTRAGRDAGRFLAAVGPIAALAEAQLAAAAAGLDEGLLSLSLSNLLYMENPYNYKKFQ